MICKYCGNNIDPSSKFCPYCNNRLENIKQNNAISNKNDNSNNKILIIIIGVLLVILIAILVYGYFKKQEGTSTGGNGNIANNKESAEKGTRTLMVYLIGSDLESNYESASLDIQEMLSSNYNDEDINIVIYAGGSSYWHNGVIDANENAIYEIEDGILNKVKSYEVASMTDTKPLTDFIDYVYDNYQSDLYSLILWDHGGGPIYGYGSDENDTTPSAMSIMDLNKAINDSNLIKETTFEFIGFDACLMSSIEIANYLKEEANYLIASSETEPGDGWDYTFLSEINRNTSSEDLGKNIIDYYYEYYLELGEYYEMFGYEYEPEITLSLIDLNKIDSLVSSIDSLFAEVETPVAINTYSKITRGATKAVMYGYIEGESIQYDLIDLYGLVDELSDYETQSILDNFNDSVIYHKSTIDDCYGLSIYFPITTKNYYDQIESVYNYDQLSVSDNYRTFLNSYVKVGNGDRIVKSNINKVVPTSQGEKLSMELPQDIADNYRSANYMIFRKIEDGSYLPIYLSRDVELSGKTITANVANKRISVAEADGSNPLDVIAIEDSRDASSVTYILSTVLQYWDEDNFLGSFETDAVSIYLKVDNKTGVGKIIDIKPITDEEDSEVAPKITYNLNDWLIMAFASSSYFMYDDSGNKLPEWQNSGTMYGTEVRIADGYKFMSSSLQDTDEYYAMFRVQDTQGHVYETELVKIN